MPEAVDPALSLRRVSKRYPNAARPALHDVSLDIGPGDRLALLGESGSGKTTLLRIIAGFEDPTAGDVLIGGVSSTRLPPERRKVTMVFQDPLLFPHLRLRENVAFGLEDEKRPAARERTRVLLRMVGLEGLEDRYPHEISGGQAQRVSLARALAPSPALLLLDEPFNNLDAILRSRLVPEVRALLEATGTPALLVTHDRTEAFGFAERVAVLRDGVIEQMDRPENLYHTPATAYVARLLGAANIVPVRADSTGWITPFGRLGKRTPLADTQGRGPELCLRPPELALTASGGHGGARGAVTAVSFQGEHRVATVRLERPVGEMDTVLVQVAADLEVRSGEAVGVCLRAPEVYRPGS